MCVCNGSISSVLLVGRNVALQEPLNASGEEGVCVLQAPVCPDTRAGRRLVAKWMIIKGKDLSNGKYHGCVLL